MRSMPSITAAGGAAPAICARTPLMPCFHASGAATSALWMIGAPQ